MCLGEMINKFLELCYRTQENKNKSEDMDIE